MFQVQKAHRETGDAVELPWSERYFAQLALVLGVNYRSDANTLVRPDGHVSARWQDRPSTEELHHALSKAAGVS